MITDNTYREYAPFLRRLARDFARDEQEADDLVQETLLYALRRPPRSLHAPKAWLRTVLRSIAINRATRNERRRRRELSRFEETAVYEAPEAMGESVRDAVFRLHEEQRIVVEAYYLRELSIEEVCGELRLSENAVKSRLKRARIRLRSDLEKRHGVDLVTALLAPFLSRAKQRPWPGHWRFAAATAAVALPVTLAWSLLGTSEADADPMDAVPVAAVAQPSATTVTTAVAATPLQPRKRRSLPGSSALLVTESADTGGPQDQGARDTTSAIPFRVFDATGDPVPRAPVRAFTPAQLADPSYRSELPDGPLSFLTDASGRGAVEEIDRDLLLGVEEDGWTTLLPGIVWRSGDPEDFVPVVVARRRTIRGTVTDVSGVPILGAIVQTRPGSWIQEFDAIRNGTRFVSQKTPTDRNGEFSLVVTSDPELLRLTANADGYSGLGTQSAVDGLTIVLERRSALTFDVSGVVLDERGRPIAGASLGYGNQTFASDDDGRFAFASPWRPGKKSSWFLDALLGEERLLWVVAEGREPVAVALEPNTEQELTVRLDAPARHVRGHVYDAQGRPVQGAELWIRDPSFFTASKGASWTLEEHASGSESWSPVRSRPDGSFRIEGLRSRRYQLAARDPRTGAEASLSVSPASRTSYDLHLSAPPPTRPLTGRLVAPDGSPVAGAVITTLDERQVLRTDSGVTMLCRRERTGREASDEEGRFRIAVREEQRIEVAEPGHVTTWFPVEDLDQDDAPLVLLRRVFLSVDPETAERLHRYEVFDEDGRRLEAHGKIKGDAPHVPAYFGSARRTFSFAETAREVLLHLHDGRRIRRPLSVRPGETHVLRL